MKTTSPFYQTGKSKSPLFDKGHPGDKKPNHHGSYNDGDLIDETDYEKLKEGTDLHNKLGDKIDAHDLETTNKLRGTNYTQ